MRLGYILFLLLASCSILPDKIDRPVISCKESITMFLEDDNCLLQDQCGKDFYAVRCVHGDCKCAINGTETNSFIGDLCQNKSKGFEICGF